MKEIETLCRPDNMALVVYDMQVAICRQVSCGAEVTANVARVLAAARSAGFPVIFMRHMSMPRKLMGRSQVRQAMAWQKSNDPDAVESWFLRDSPGFQIVPELAPTSGEAILDKVTFSAFESTPLALILRDLGLTTFAICGIAMEIGIDPTVRHGADLGFTPVVIRNACGAGHSAAADRSWANIEFMGDAILSDVEEITALMARPGLG
jgi:nicotinamidase-related amidase